MKGKQMDKYRIMKRTYWSNVYERYDSYYYVDKKALGLFWIGCNNYHSFNTLEDAENWIKSKSQNVEGTVVVKEISY